MNRWFGKLRLGPLLGTAGSLICLGGFHLRTSGFTLPVHGASKNFALFCVFDLPILLSGAVSGALIERFARTRVLNDERFSVNKAGTIIGASIAGLAYFVIGLALGLALGCWLAWHIVVLWGADLHGLAWRIVCSLIPIPISTFVIATLVTLFGGALGARAGRSRRPQKNI